MFKKLSLCLALAFCCAALHAQTSPVKYPNLDASPMDALYYPLNAVKVKKEDTSLPLIKVVYSRPQKKGREIFGVLEQFDKVWRLGANENTEIYFAKAVTIGDKKIKAGTYALFAIPGKEKWTIIVNKQTDRWGAFNYDQSKDVVRVDVPVTKLEKAIESFSMTFVDQPEGANLMMAWDTTQVALPILFKK
ncbi:MAG: DUF2911 domain-containing protein [Pedobacter sp.]|nr:DUF2911 domain-containing protein [Pedobacter sp.]MDQ8052468.1 DUF2911 domain-containing protein [Pedobacter sp.]